MILYIFGDHMKFLASLVLGGIMLATSAQAQQLPERKAHPNVLVQQERHEQPRQSPVIHAAPNEQVGREEGRREQGNRYQAPLNRIDRRDRREEYRARNYAWFIYMNFYNYNILDVRLANPGYYYIIVDSTEFYSWYDSYSGTVYDANGYNLGCTDWNSYVGNDGNQYYASVCYAL